ncbi:hypothetical protein PRIPAC_74985 [Pristionchus pacificus]|nr:hypothetical protein PRIPAC_74985 [Pristionchus pacificus]
MSKIFYYGVDNNVYGPHTELTVQGWYASGFFASDVRFQISSSDRFDPSGSLFTLGELIEKNGRILPFYFSPEKEIREKEHDKTLQKLKEDVESLTTNKEKYVEKGSIDNLQNQIASILKSNATLLNKVQELSSKKESSPVTPDLEKKLNELKREVEKQEKSAGSMKKVMSDNTSKCDRNDTKMELTMKKQKEMEVQMTAHSNEIAGLQANGKDIETNLTACRETMRVSADQCGEMMNTWKEMNEAMNKQTVEWPAIRSELQQIQAQITEVIATMDVHKERVNAVEKKSEELRAEFVKGETTSEKKKSELSAQQSCTMTSATPPPWELAQKKVDSDRIEPWNRPQPSTTNGTFAVKAAAKSRSESKVEVAPVKSAMAPKPKAKNWDAICKELSDDEEDEEEDVEESALEALRRIGIREHVRRAYSATGKVQEILDARPVVPPENRRVIDSFMSLFRQYLDALRSVDQVVFKWTSNMTPAEEDVFSGTLMNWHPESADFLPLAQAVLIDLPKMCEDLELLCCICRFRIFFPINVFDHFIDGAHMSKLEEVGGDVSLLGSSVQLVLLRIGILLNRTTPVERENSLALKGLVRYKECARDPNLRPTQDFRNKMWLEYRDRICMGDARAMKLSNIEQTLNAGDHEYYMRVIRKWFKVEKNREKFLHDLNAHLATGIPHCMDCQVAFDTIEEYYKHATSYFHARVSHRMLEGCFIRLARGTVDWDISM